MPFLQQPLLSLKENKHKHSQIWGTVPGLGGWQFVCVFFGSHSLCRENHINKSPEHLGTIPENFVYVFFLTPVDSLDLCTLCHKIIT